MINLEFDLDDEQAVFVGEIMSPNKTIVFCNARAGTGKTTLAMCAANVLVKDKRNHYDGIVYIVSPYGEDKQGYLPGDITQKSEIYYEPAYQAMAECGLNPFNDVTKKALSEKKKYGDGDVKLLTHTYLRGTNLSNKVIIVDEAQNFTVAELKKVLTRIHDNCKVIIVGHTGQIDISAASGFAMYIEHFRDQERCAVCELTINHRGWLSTHADALDEKKVTKRAVQDKDC